MTGKQKVVLRTAFSDVFRVGDLEITQSGTEINASDVEPIQELARRNGVTLHVVEDPEHVADFAPVPQANEVTAPSTANKTEGSDK